MKAFSQMHFPKPSLPPQLNMDAAARAQRAAALQQANPTMPQTPSQDGPGYMGLSFNVPFASNLAGPDADEILHATPGAADRWLHPSENVEGTEPLPTHKLPVHANNVEDLRNLCKEISNNSEGKLGAVVTVSEPKQIPGMRKATKGFVTNVCLSGEPDLVYRTRGSILQQTPVELVGLPLLVS
jgi:hypothetical protein